MSGTNLIGDDAIRVWIYFRSMPVTTSRLKHRQFHILLLSERLQMLCAHIVLRVNIHVDPCLTIFHPVISPAQRAMHPCLVLIIKEHIQDMRTVCTMNYGLSILEETILLAH